MRLQNIHTAKVDGVEPKGIVTVDDAERASRMLASKLFVDADAPVAAPAPIPVDQLEAEKAARNAEAGRMLAGMQARFPVSPDQQLAGLHDERATALAAQIETLQAKIVELQSKLADEAEMQKLLDEAANRIDSLEAKVAELSKPAEESK
jgi:hypothetical protein